MENNRNILFLGDPNSIHDRKWMTWLAGHTAAGCFLIYRQKHGNFSEAHRNEITSAGITILEGIADFSVLKPWKNNSPKNTLKSIIDQHKIGICQIYYGEPNALWTSFLKSKHLKVFLTTRGSDVLIGMKMFAGSKSFKDRLIWRKYKSCLKQADQVFSTSGAQKNWLLEKIQGLKEPQIVRTGIDLGAITTFKDKSPKRWDKRIFFPRNMQPLYQHEFAIRSILSLPEAVLQEYVFTFVDKNSSNQAYVNQIESMMQENPHVRFEFIDSQNGEAYYEYLYHSSLVVMTPKSDGAPVSAMETLALETPLIMPDLHFDRELFSTAVFYTPGEAGELVAQITSLLSKPATNVFTSDLEKAMSQQIQMQTVLKAIYERA